MLSNANDEEIEARNLERARIARVEGLAETQEAILWGRHFLELASSYVQAARNGVDDDISNMLREHAADITIHVGELLMADAQQHGGGLRTGDEE
jgi:hypothetical protein